MLPKKGTIMNMRTRGPVAHVSLLLLAAAAIGVFSAPASAATTCKPATNIEAIIDDSGSMSFTDASNNRTEAIKLLISKPGNAGKTLGAVQFGSDQSYLTPPVPAAVTLFKPQKIGPNVNPMKALLDSQILNDNGATDYNAAFALAKADNPSADAWIFITDGGHNEGEYMNGHVGGPTTYVLGMMIGAPSPTDVDANRLQQIATDNHGIYYPNVTNANIQATVNAVDAALNCQLVAKTFTDQFKKAGQTKSKAVSVSSKAKSIDLTLTWASPLDSFTITGIRLKPRHGATISIAKKRLKIKRVSGKTYLSAKVSGLKRGKLLFKLKAKTLGSGGGNVSLTTQAVPSKKR